MTMETQCLLHGINKATFPDTVKPDISAKLILPSPLPFFMAETGEVDEHHLGQL